MKKSLLLAGVLFSTVPAFAQFTSGSTTQEQQPQQSGSLTQQMLGARQNATAFQNTDYKAVEKYSRLNFGYDLWTISASGSDGTGYNGFYIDWVIQGTPLSRTIPLYLEWGLRFNAEFYSKDENGFKTTANNMAIAVPLNLTYRLPLGDSGVKLSPYAGINFKVNVSGKQTSEYQVEEEHRGFEGTRHEFTYTTNSNQKIERNPYSKDDMGSSDATFKRFQMGWQIGANLDIKKFTIGLSYGTDFIQIAKKVNTSTFTVGIGFNF